MIKCQIVAVEPELLTWQNSSPAVWPLLEMLQQQVVGDGPHAAAAVADVVQQLLLGNVPVKLCQNHPHHPPTWKCMSTPGLGLE